MSIKAIQKPSVGDFNSHKDVVASVTHLGGIDDKIKGVTLTGSATLWEVNSASKNLKILIDYGLFQGGINDAEYNKVVDKKALAADILVLTHAHIDHCGRIPYLVKQGFSGPIYMTEPTAMQAREILLDSVKIQKENIDKADNFRKNTLDRLKRMQSFIKKYDNLYSGDVQHNKENNKSLKSSLEKAMNTLGFDGIQSPREAYIAATNYLNERDIVSDKDIERLDFPVPELLYDEADIDQMFNQVEYIDVGEEVSLENFSYITDIDDKTIPSLVDKVTNVKKVDLQVSKNIFQELRNEIDKEIKEVQDATQYNAELFESNEKLKEEIKIKLEQLEENELEDDLILDPELKKSYLEFLASYNVNSEEDIPNALQKYKTIKYDINDLYRLKRSIKSKDIPNDLKFKAFLEGVKLKFENAGHIEGSVQVILEAITSKVKHIIGESHINNAQRKMSTGVFAFTGDLGRFESPDPLVGIPTISEKKLDYIQMESTYANRNHIEREKSEEELINVIKNAQGKVIIPTFAMQRAQSILTLILNSAKEEGELKNRVKELKQLEKNTKDKKLKDSYNHEKEKLAQTLLSYKTYVLDSPLAQKIANIYVKKFEGKYDILNPKVQDEIFGRQMIKTIGSSEERDALYSQGSNHNEVIITSSGMCEGGPILAHLPKILGDKNATLVFIGYAPDTTRGGLLKKGEEINIDGKTYIPNCNIVDLKGFSSHIGHNGIIEYLKQANVSKKTQLILNHGGESRIGLAKDISDKTKINSKNTYVPGLGDTMYFRVS